MEKQRNKPLIRIKDEMISRVYPIEPSLYWSNENLRSRKNPLNEIFIKRDIPALPSEIEVVKNLASRFGESKLESPIEDSLNPEIYRLTSRELEVVRLMAKGLTNSEIGKELSISAHTIQNHNTKIFDRLQVRNRTEVVIKLIQLGVLNPTDRGQL